MPQITTRLSPEIRDRFKRYAAKLGLDASELARLLILREMRVRCLKPGKSRSVRGRDPHKRAGEQKLTAHFHLTDNIAQFEKYAQTRGFSRAAAARLIAEQELHEKWLAKALVWCPPQLSRVRFRQR